MTPLLPKEHGAYAQLAFPLLTGMALAVPSLSTLALGGAAVAFFLANESAAILLGARGMRLRDQEAPRAKVQGSVLLVVGAILGAVGLVAGWPEIWPEVLLPAVTGTLLFLMVLIGRQKTLLGEFLVITAFSTLVLSMAASSGVDPTRAALTAAVCLCLSSSLTAWPFSRRSAGIWRSTPSSEAMNIAIGPTLFSLDPAGGVWARNQQRAIASRLRRSSSRYSRGASFKMLPLFGRSGRFPGGCPSPYDLKRG